MYRYNGRLALGLTFNCSAVCALSSSRTMDWLPASTASSSGIFPLWNDAMSRISFFHSLCLARSLFSSMKLKSSFCRSLTSRFAGGLRPSTERDPGFALLEGSLPPSAIPSRRGHSTRTLAKHELLARSAPCYCTNTLRSDPRHRRQYPRLCAIFQMYYRSDAVPHCISDANLQRFFCL